MRVGFIGLGTMGAPMAVNVAKAGFDLTVYDLREEPLRKLAGLGARVARSAREVGERGEVVEVTVVDDAQVEAVVLGEEGVLAGAAPGTILAIHSTVPPGTVKKIAQLASVKGVGVLDAQVSGGEGGAQEKTLCYMVGGDRGLLERCRPVFAASGSNIFHMGECGTGAIAKSIQQVIVCVNMLAASEGMLLCEKAGLDPAALREVVRASAGQSYVMDKWFERFRLTAAPASVRRRRMEVFHKSLSPALELARDLGVFLPGTALAQQLLDRVLGLDDR